MSEVLAVRANSNGRLQISISTENVKLDTDWTNCTNPQMSKWGHYVSLLKPHHGFFHCLFFDTAQDVDPTQDHDKPDPDQLFTVLVSLRSFLKFLNSHVVSTTTIACAYIQSSDPPRLTDIGVRYLSQPLLNLVCLYWRCG